MSERAWLFYVSDMLEFANRTRSYTENLSQAEFINDSVVYDATLRNLELIGEAATHIPKEERALYSEIPWRMIIATRNQLIHAYLGIDNDTVWSIIEDDIPGLIGNLEKIIRDKNE